MLGLERQRLLDGEDRGAIEPAAAIARSGRSEQAHGVSRPQLNADPARQIVIREPLAPCERAGGPERPGEVLIPQGFRSMFAPSKGAWSRV